MPRTKYRKKTKNGNTYYFFRLTHKNLRKPRDLYGKTVSELDEKIQVLTINKTLDYQKDKHSKKFTHSLNSPKTKTSNRTIPFPDFLASYLKRTRTKELEKKIRLQNKFADRDLVFSNRLGDYLNGSSIRVSLNSILTEASLPHFRFHDLRHTFATRLFEMGESPKTIQSILGHTDVATTLNIYTHVLKEQTIKSAYKLHKLNDEFLLKNL